MSDQIDNAEAVEVQAQEAMPEALPSVGTLLRNARESRSLPVADIAQALKLGQRQVEALERDDWSVLPGTTFIRGFVRNYARLVDIDPAPLMERLENLLEKPVDTLAVPAAAPARISSASKSRDGLVVGIGGLLLILAALAYFLLPNDLTALRDAWQGLLGGTEVAVEPAPPPAAPAQETLFPPDTSAQQLIAPQAAPAEGATPQPAPAVPAEAAVATSQLRFVLSQASWLEVRDRDDTVIFSQRLIAGTEQTVEGRGPLSVTIGYAPGVKLLHRGQVVNLEPHTRGDVARLVLE
ncbi:helix-turn-helix domain-containing protein [uncultured Azonexus sp.]|uniref:helix-turn-helix domain-containing protein n=1 Tax=uncultured Azonexus sp. TaxID=520307 RepID=UPI0026129FA0|nr:helix-turn-helix domain-containing protein [uncultured Azonexus sp.]